MKIVADESVDKAIVEILRNNNYEVYYIAEESPSLKDRFVLEKANELDALLLTADKDFGEMVFYRKFIAKGVLLCRFAGINADKKSELVLKTVEMYGEKLSKSFTVVTKNKIRIRNILQ